jgi:N-acetylglutamate synthase-like GNAT family acetyltransferase
MAEYQIRPINETDKEWVLKLLKKEWAGPVMITRGNVHDVGEYPGFIAVEGGERAGLITYHIEGKECEITSMNSLAEGKGIGRALVDEVKKESMANRCKRLFLVTTNDNTHALKFWQKYGFSLIALRPNIMEEYRRLKPEIPLTGDDGIPLRDELELEMVL